MLLQRSTAPALRQELFPRIDRTALGPGLREAAADDVSDHHRRRQDPGESSVDDVHDTGGDPERDDRENRPDELTRQERRSRLGRVPRTLLVPVAADRSTPVGVLPAGRRAVLVPLILCAALRDPHTSVVATERRFAVAAKIA